MQTSKYRGNSIQFLLIPFFLLSSFSGNSLVFIPIESYGPLEGIVSLEEENDQEVDAIAAGTKGDLLNALADAGLFDEDEILQISLSGKMKDLLKDKSEKPQDYPLVLSYGNDDTNTLPVNVKTRGNFRRLLGNCAYLPLMIKFSPSSELDKSIFREQIKLKLVMPCANERYLIREWLAYKLYNLINPKSFRVRLVKVRLIPEKEKGKINEVFGFLLEEEKQLGRRLDLVRVKQIVLPKAVERENYLKMTLFEYLIGNTDWSVKYRQNIKIFYDNKLASNIAIPYDFDFSGLVGSPYAKPPAALELASTRDRRYRGFCIEDMKQYEAVLAEYESLKPEIYNLFRSCEYLEERDLKLIEKFIDGFYKNINNAKRIERDLLYPCDPNGTGNVEISGLQN